MATSRTGADLDARIGLEQLKLYADNHAYDKYLIPILAGTVGVILSVWVSAIWVIAWVIADTLLVVAYSMLCSRFIENPSDAPLWAMRIGCIHGIHTLLWYSVVWWAWEPFNLDNHLFILLVYMGVVSASAVRSNPHEGLFDSELIPPILAVATVAFLGGSLVYYSLSLGALLYTFLMFLMGKRYQRNVLDMIRLKIENESLIGILKEQASTDSLTGARNRKTFIELGEAEMQRSLRFRHPLSLLLLDIDRFKDINDTYGHLPADRVIQAVIGVCREAMRTEDILGRLGGDEFGFILPETRLEQAKVFAERIRESISKVEVRIEGKIVKVTASIGLTMLLGEEDTMPDMLHRADMAMYRAKIEGRNRVVCMEGVGNK